MGCFAKTGTFRAHLGHTWGYEKAKTVEISTVSVAERGGFELACIVPLCALVYPYVAHFKGLNGVKKSKPCN